MKVLKRVGNAWYLITTRGSSYAVRALAGGSASLAPRLAAEIVDAPERSWDARDLWLPGDAYRRPASTIPYQQVTSWCAIAAQLEDDPESFVRQRPTAPRTPLRKLCSWLRTAPRSAHHEFATTWLKDPRALATEFLDSVQAFEEYANDEPFVPPGRSGRSLQPSTKFAREAVRIVRDKSFVEIGATRFQYAGYEISPRRTTGAQLEAEETNNPSGLGGIDLALTDGTGVAIVEVKAATDTTLLFALVQSLMYAAELVSPEQQRRLAKYGLDPDAELQPDLSFLATANPPYIDIIILFEVDASQAAELDAVARLSELLLSDAGSVSTRSFIRRIHFVAGAIREGELCCEQMLVVSAGRCATL